MGERAEQALLLADDDPGNRRVVAAFLRRCGYQVDGAAGGREAVTALSRDTYAVVVSELLDAVTGPVGASPTGRVGS